MKPLLVRAFAVLSIFAAGPAGPAARAQEKTNQSYMEVYNVRDLVMARRDFPMKRLNQPAPSTREDELITVASTRLVNEIRAALSARDISASTYTLRDSQSEPAGRIPGTILLVKGTPEVHAAIAEFLERARQLTDVIFHIETWIYRIHDPKRNLPERLLEEPLGEKDTMFLLDPEQARALQQEMNQVARKKDANVKIIAAPRITTQNGQRANTIIVNRLSYIADYHRIKVMGGKTDVLDPVVKCVEEGVGFDIKVTQDSDDPDRARMEIFYQNARLKKPVEERRTEHGVLQLPEVHTVNLQFALNVKLPGHVLLASRFRPEEGVDLVLIHVRRDTLEPMKSPMGSHRAPVVGLSRTPARDGRKRVIIEAGTRAGLEKGMTVRFHAADPKDARALFTGRIERVHDDLAVAVLDTEQDLDPRKIATLMAGWDPATKQEKK